MRGYLRDAQTTDRNLLFLWANEQMVRKNSFSTEKIPYEDHVQWYETILQRTDCRQYIYEYEGNPVGQIRIVFHGEKAEINYSICAESRGKGLGKEMLCLMREKVKSEFPEVKYLIAKVKPENENSSNAILGSGFQEKYRVYELTV